MRDSGRENIDNEKDRIVHSYSVLRLRIEAGEHKQTLSNEILKLKQDLKSFRVMLGSDRGTENLENVCGWRMKFEEISNYINQINSIKVND